MVGEDTCWEAQSAQSDPGWHHCVNLFGCGGTLDFPTVCPQRVPVSSWCRWTVRENTVRGVQCFVWLKVSWTVPLQGGHLRRNGCPQSSLRAMEEWAAILISWMLWRTSCEFNMARPLGTPLRCMMRCMTRLTVMVNGLISGIVFQHERNPSLVIYFILNCGVIVFAMNKHIWEQSVSS